MKKSIVYLGVALLAFTNVSLASNSNFLEAAKIVTTAYEGVKPFSAAIIKGDVEAVKKFIEYGVNVNEKSNGMSPFDVCSTLQQGGNHKNFIGKRSQSHAKDEKGLTALKYAQLSNANDAVLILKQV